MPNSPNQEYLPPKLADRFFVWFCKEAWVEPLLGDLFEQYQIDCQRHSLFKAKALYWINIINLLRPFALKRNRRTANHIAMLNHFIKTFFRQLKRNPSQNFINISGLCIGFCVVILTVFWINYHTSFDQFHTDVENIYEVKTTSSDSEGISDTYSGMIFEIMQEAQDQIPEIEEVTRIISNWRWPSEQCLKIDENAQCIYSKGIFADTSFFKIFDFKVIAGSKNPLFEPRSIALSASVAKKLYGDQNPVGSTYLVDNHYEVVVAAVYEDVPSNSSLQFEFIAPLELAYALWGRSVDQLGEHSFITYAKLQEGKHAVAQAKMNDLPITSKYENLSSLLHPLNQVHLYTEFKNGRAQGGLIDYIQIIGLFALFILIMCMVNFINLTTAQASIRGKEIGVRKVNGASRSMLHFQLIFETFLKVFIAVVAALGISYFTLPVLADLLNQNISFIISNTLIAQIATVIILTTILSGVYPAIVLSRFSPVQILKNLPFKSDGKGFARKGLTVVQMSISGIIVILTIIFYLQLNYLQNENTGYDRQGIMMMGPTWNHIKGFDSFKANLQSHHLIKSVGISNVNMINANNSTDGVHWPGKNTQDQIFFRMIGGDNGLIDVFELEYMEGQGFNPSDTTDQVVLTASAVKRMNLENPIGRTIEVWDQPCKISGVVNDFNTESLHSPMLPTIIYEIKPNQAGTFYIRYENNEPIASIEIIEKEYQALEPFFNMKYTILDDEYSKAYDDERVISILSIFVTAIAMVIAVIGILGLSSFNILRRYREIGLRKIFGATGFQIIQLLSKEFIIMVVISNLLAWAFSIWAVGEWLSGFAYRIETPYAVLLLNLIVTLVIILALVGLQSLRITKLNPVEVVRNE